MPFVPDTFFDFYKASLMKLTRMQYTIGQLMTLVVIAGGINAWMRVPNAGVISVAIILILPLKITFVIFPFMFASTERRLLVASWVASLWPITNLWSLHIAWIIAYGYLGHAPRPTDKSEAISYVASLVMLSMITSLFSMVICICLSISSSQERFEGRGYQNNRKIPVLIMPVIWISLIMFMRWDPLGAGAWFMD